MQINILFVERPAALRRNFQVAGALGQARAEGSQNPFGGGKILLRRNQMNGWLAELRGRRSKAYSK